MNQPTNQSFQCTSNINQSTNQPINQPTNKSINQSINHYACNGFISNKTLQKRKQKANQE
jgi:hypothetical protein